MRECHEGKRSIKTCHYLYSFLRAGTLVFLDEVLSHGEYALDSVSVGRKFSLEGLVLLVLRLDVGRVLFVRQIKQYLNKMKCL
jgi:hypothetical protein